MGKDNMKNITPNSNGFRPMSWKDLRHTLAAWCVIILIMVLVGVNKDKFSSIADWFSRVATKWSGWISDLVNLVF